MRWNLFHSIKNIVKISKPFSGPKFNFRGHKNLNPETYESIPEVQPCIFKTHFNVMFKSTTISYGLVAHFKNYRFTSCMNLSSHWCFVHISIYNTDLEPVSYIIYTQEDDKPKQAWQDQIGTVCSVNLNQPIQLKPVFSEQGRALDCTIDNSHMAMATIQKKVTPFT